ncbi:MAG: hypothetical protein ACTHJ5_04085 [Ilyomonas sp.]
MKLHFTRNIHFTKLLKAEGRTREFNFRKMRVEGEDLFSVDVVDNRGNRIIFKMRKENGVWKIIPQTLPEWVTELEDKFSEAIEEELRNAS